MPDLSGQPVTREGDTITIGNGEPTHEIDITVSDEEYEAISRPSRRKRSMTLPRRSTMKAIRSIWKIRNTRSRSCGRIPYSFFLPAWLTPSSGPRAGNV